MLIRSRVQLEILQSCRYMLWARRNFELHKWRYTYYSNLIYFRNHIFLTMLTFEKPTGRSTSQIYSLENHEILHLAPRDKSTAEKGLAGTHDLNLRFSESTEPLYIPATGQSALSSSACRVRSGDALIRAARLSRFPPFFCGELFLFFLIILILERESGFQRVAGGFHSPTHGLEEEW